jgi:hypothetical protein
MANRTILGVYQQPDDVGEAVTRLRQAGYDDNEFDILSGTPYPEGTFGERVAAHRLYIFPIVGAIIGFSIALLITAGTQLSFPLITGGKPILAIPPMLIIMYEGTMLGAILSTVIGVIFESRLPRFDIGVYDTRITEGYIGLLVACTEEQTGSAERLLRETGADDVKKG